MADVVLVEALHELTYRPQDDGFVARLPTSVQLPMGTAKNITGLEVSSSLSRWPVRAFELWSDRHLGTYAVAVVDHHMPTAVFRRPLLHAAANDSSELCASDLFISGADDSFTGALLRPPMSGLIHHLPRAWQLMFIERFVILGVQAGEPCGLRSLIESCADIVAAIPAAALSHCTVADETSTDPLAATN